MFLGGGLICEETRKSKAAQKQRSAGSQKLIKVRIFEMIWTEMGSFCLGGVPLILAKALLSIVISQLSSKGLRSPTLRCNTRITFKYPATLFGLSDLAKKARSQPRLIGQRGLGSYQNTCNNEGKRLKNFYTLP